MNLSQYISDLIALLIPVGLAIGLSCVLIMLIVGLSHESFVEQERAESCRLKGWIFIDNECLEDVKR